MPFIHPTAEVHPKAKLADTVNVGPFVIIEENVSIGEGTILESNNLISNGARIGKNCVISHGTAISTIPQDNEIDYNDCLLIIGDNTKVREYCTLNRGTKLSSRTSIGSNALLMAYCHVGHDCVIGNNTVVANGVQMGSHSLIDDHAIVGGMVVILESCRIGKHCMIGGAAYVDKDIPPYTMAGIYPIAFEGLNSIGLRRRGFSRDAIETLDKLYAMLFLSGDDIAEAVQKIKSDLPSSPEVEEVLDFIAQSSRGILQARIQSHSK